MEIVKRYYWLIKPGIVYSNVIAAIAGFSLASAQVKQLDLGLFFATIGGTGLVIASACVLNNYMDRGIDRKMKRTRSRATASSEISGRSAIIYSVILGMCGFTILALFTNWLTFGLGVLAYFAYIVLYGFAKRTTAHGTLVGSISGGLPPVAGYAAVTGHLDMGALLLFFVLVSWQMPHFYAIAMRRYDDYAAAKLPVLPVVKGMKATKLQIMTYIGVFIAANLLLTVFGYTGFVFAGVMVLLGVLWFAKGMRGFATETSEKWAKKMFLFSLITLLGMCLMIAIGGLLP